MALKTRATSPGLERHFVHEAVECHIVCCKADRVCGELDAGNLSEVWGECECEEAHTAVCIYEVCRGQGARCGRGHGRKNGVVDV